MAIPCPGSDTHSHIFGVGRNGPNAFIAYLRALLALVFEIATSAGLRKFLAQDCASPCDKVLTGPDFSRFTVRLRPRAGGGWSCVMGGLIEAKIECVQVEATLTDEECLREIMAQLHDDDRPEQTRAKA